MSIRSTSKAVIINGGKVLLSRCRDPYNGDYYSLPGGGQNTYETMEDAVVRECLEETGYTVRPLRLGALCEEICDSPEFRENYPEYAHKMYHIFVCELEDVPQKAPTEQDSMQLESVWVDIADLPSTRLLPDMVGDSIGAIIAGDVPLFLGFRHIPYNHG